MPSQVSISNQALAAVGGNLIVSFSDGTTEANLCAALWTSTVDTVLAAYPWPCAIKRASLAMLATSPAFGYSAAFQLPSDCLRVLDTDDDRRTWKREGRTLLADASAVSIRYLSNAADVQNFDAPLVATLAARMAAELAPAVAQSNSLTTSMWELYERKLKEARATLSLEGSSEAFLEGDLVRVR